VKIAPGSGIAGPNATSSNGRQASAGARSPNDGDKVERGRSAGGDLATDPSPEAASGKDADAFDQPPPRARPSSRIVASRIAQARTVGSARSGATATRITSAHAADPGPALERDRRLLDQHLGAVRGAQAASAGGGEERRLGRDVDEVEHGGWTPAVVQRRS
jgi:hypothetical protein